MDELINSLVGSKVQLQSTSEQGGYKDTGILEAYQYPWLKLINDKREVIYFNSRYIRLIKPL